MTTDCRSVRKGIFADLGNVSLCAVTKGASIREIESLLEDLPAVKIIAESRWPDCEEKFIHFSQLEKHFIGPLQKNKVKKVVPLVDVIQSVDTIDLLEKINQAAFQSNKIVKFCFQVNVSRDPLKRGIMPEELMRVIEAYLALDLKQVRLIGLMTIGAQESAEKRREYFRDLRRLFDLVNERYFPDKPLGTLSMGMSEDFREAVLAGATMVRLGSCLF